MKLLLKNLRKRIHWIFIILILGSCGRPSEKISEALVQENTLAHAFLTSDYQLATQLHFPHVKKIYTFDGGDYGARKIGEVLWVFAKDGSENVYRFNQEGKLLQPHFKIPGQLQALERRGEILLFSKLFDCKLYNLENQVQFDLSKFSNLVDYCESVDEKTGTGANKIFGIIPWLTGEYVFTYDKFFQVPNLNEGGVELNQIGELSFGNPYAGIATWPDNSGYLIVAQSGPYVGEVRSGIDIFDSLGTKIHSFKGRDLLEINPRARVIDSKVKENGKILILMVDWNNEDPRANTSYLVELTWFGQVKSEVLHKISNVAWAMTLRNGSQVTLSTLNSFVHLNWKSGKLEEKEIKQDYRGQSLENPSRIWDF